MSKPFVHPTDAIVESLIQVFKLQNKLATVNILECAQARIEETDYDNWDGGTYLFTLFLDVPLKLYTYHEQNISEFEQAISKKLSTILRNTGNQRLSHVILAPILAKPAARTATSKPTVDDVSRIWGTKGLRLFLSHIADHKTEVAGLKNELGIYGITGFVAHEDIKPTQEWESELFLALNSAHALAALLTAGFQSSDWTDQEVGFALGRGLLVIPVKLGMDPYGFMARKQAMPGGFEKIDKIASDLMDILLRHNSTSKIMHEALVMAFETAKLYMNAIKISQAIIKTTDFTQEQLRRIQQASQANEQVAKAYGVPEKIETYLSANGLKTEEDPF